MYVFYFSPPSLVLSSCVIINLIVATCLFDCCILPKVLVLRNVFTYLLDVLLCYYASQNFYMCRILLFINITCFNYNFVHVFRVYSCLMLHAFLYPKRLYCMFTRIDLQLHSCN